MVTVSKMNSLIFGMVTYYSIYRLLIKNNIFTTLNTPNKHKILVIKTRDDFVKFYNTYHYTDPNFSNTIINWNSVIDMFGRIELLYDDTKGFNDDFTVGAFKLFFWSNEILKNISISLFDFN